MDITTETVVIKAMFLFCASTTSGGAISTSAKLTLEDCLFHSCLARDKGGSLFASANINICRVCMYGSSVPDKNGMGAAYWCERGDQSTMDVILVEKSSGNSINIADNNIEQAYANVNVSHGQFVFDASTFFLSPKSGTFASYKYFEAHDNAPGRASLDYNGASNKPEVHADYLNVIKIDNKPSDWGAVYFDYNNGFLSHGVFLDNENFHITKYMYQGTVTLSDCVSDVPIGNIDGATTHNVRVAANPTKLAFTFYDGNMCHTEDRVTENHESHFDMKIIVSILFEGISHITFNG